VRVCPKASNCPGHSYSVASVAYYLDQSNADFLNHWTWYGGTVDVSQVRPLYIRTVNSCKVAATQY